MSDPFVVTPNEFGGSDVERINQALQAAAGTGRRVVIPRRNEGVAGGRDLWLLDAAILVPGDTVLELNNCHLKLSDGCRDNMIRSANCGLGITDIAPLHGLHIYGVGNVVLEGADRPRATGDSGKTLGERTYGTDAGVAGESQQGDWRNIGVLLAFVEDFSLSGLTMRDTHCWAISLERCAHGTVRDLSFTSTGSKLIDGVRQTILNQDGLDLRMGCHDILMENITGHTGDDLIALTAIANPKGVAGALGTTMVSATRDRGEGRDAIRHVTIRDVRGYCAGGHHIVRFLNTSGVHMYDLVLDGLTDTSPEGHRGKAALKIGDSHYGDGVAPLGQTRRLIVRNVISRSEHAILIGGSLCDSLISEVICHGAGNSAVTMAAGEDQVRDVTFTHIITSAAS